MRVLKAESWLRISPVCLLAEPGFSPGTQLHRYQSHFIVCCRDYSADGGDARTGQMALFTPRFQANKNLFFPEVGKQSDDHYGQRRSDKR
ncbi:hypothetical protein AO411_2025895 [Salmonella enterica subsp. enterica serovar Sarajane]|nr:hypothetical protein AO411_2025895 [Salmonella enterica subsp. enterica serovar Sarajane]